MSTRFSVETRNRFAKIVNVGMLASLVSSLVTFAPMVPAQAAAIALKSYSTTMSRPIFSSTSNAQFAWKLNTAIVVGGGASCLVGTPHAGGCAEFTISLGSDSSTNPIWNSPAFGDFAFTGLPAEAVVSSTVTQTGSTQVTLYVDCSAACAFPADSAMTLTVVNNPITTPVAPGWVTPGVYATYPTRLDVTDAVNTASMTSIIALGKGLTVSASVDPVLTFSVTGNPLASGVKNEISNVAPTDADTCNFGTLTPTVAKICAFSLHIATNASNGYSIYVVQDQNMTFNGNAIKQFNSGSIATHPGAAWASPSSVQLAHLGYWSSDSSVFSGVDLFPNWAGIPNIAAAGAAPVTTALVADASLPESNDYTYAIKIESAATLPQGTGYTHHEY
ncbi:MAG: hypothetical protein WCK01_04840, partial [Candidatus Uhrbacteria bacterium]